MPIFSYTCTIPECNHKFDHLILSSRPPEPILPCEKCKKDAKKDEVMLSSFNAQYLTWDRVGS